MKEKIEIIIKTDNVKNHIIAFRRWVKVDGRTVYSDRVSPWRYLHGQDALSRFIDLCERDAGYRSKTANERCDEELRRYTDAMVSELTQAIRQSLKHQHKPRRRTTRKTDPKRRSDALDAIRTTLMELQRFMEQHADDIDVPTFYRIKCGIDGIMAETVR